MTFLGIDLHSNSFVCCFIYENGKKHKIAFELNEPSMVRSFSTYP